METSTASGQPDALNGLLDSNLDNVNSINNLTNLNNNLSSGSHSNNEQIKFITSQQAVNNINGIVGSVISNETNDHEQIKLLKEIRDMKEKIRKLQQEIDEKSLIITEFKDELEQTKEQYDKLKHDNLNLIQDAKQAKILRDENDILQERVLKIDQLERDIIRHKDKIVELEFFKIRNAELEDDYNKLNDSKCHVEEQLSQCHKKLDKLSELEQELDKWRNYSQEINTERDTLQARILELIDNETKLKSHNDRAEDELVRLKQKLKDFQDKQEELEESNQHNITNHQLLNEHLAHLDSSPHSTPPSSSLASSISQHHHSLELKLELEKQKQQELTEENKQLKNKLNELRQDLACEKSINDQLSRRFKNFNCTIRNIDRNFPASVTADFNKSNTDSRVASLDSNVSSTTTTATTTTTTTISTGATTTEKKCDDEKEKEANSGSTTNSNGDRVVESSTIQQQTPIKLTPTTPSTSTLPNGHDSGFLSIGQDANLEGQSSHVKSTAITAAPTKAALTVATSTSADQELKSTNNNLLTVDEIKTSQVINPIVVRPGKTSIPATAATTLTADTATTTNATFTTTKSVISQATTSEIPACSTVNNPPRTTPSKSCTTVSVGNNEKVNQSSLVTSNQSQSINLHSLCSPTKTCENDDDLLKAKIDSIQDGNNQRAKSRYASTKEIQQQVCQLSESSSSSPSSTPSSSASISCSSAASSTRCSPHLMGEDGVALSIGGSNRSSSPLILPSTQHANSVGNSSTLGTAIVEEQQQSESMIADRGINDYSASPPSSQLSTRNSLLNSSASGTKLASNFVRNSCPSRSINFGHSSSYLERYRSAQQQQQHQLQLANHVASPAAATTTTSNPIANADQQLHHRLHPTFAHNFLAAHPPSNTGVAAISGGGQSSPSMPQHPAHLLNTQQQHQRIYQQPSSVSITGVNNGGVNNGSYISQVQTQQVNYENGAHMLQIGAKLNYVPSRPNAAAISHHHHQQQQHQHQHQHQHLQHQHIQHQQQVHHQLHHLDQSFNTMSLNRHARVPNSHHRLASALVDADYVASPHAAHMLAHHHHHHHIMPIIHQHPVSAVHGAPVQSPVNKTGSGMQHNSSSNNQHIDNNNGLSPIASHHQSPSHQQRVPLVWPLASSVLVDGQPSLVQQQQHANGVDNDNRYHNTPNTPIQNQDQNNVNNGLVVHQQQVRHQQQVNTTPDASSMANTNGLHHPQHQLIVTSPGSSIVHPHHHPHHLHHHHQQQHQHSQQQQQQQLHNHHRRSHNHHHHHLCQSRTMYTVSPIDSPVNLGTQEIIGLPEVGDNSSYGNLLRQQQQQHLQNQRNSSASGSSSVGSSASESSSSSFSNLSSSAASTPNEDNHHNDKRNGSYSNGDKKQHSTGQKKMSSSKTTKFIYSNDEDDVELSRKRVVNEQTARDKGTIDNDNDDFGQMSLIATELPKHTKKHQHDGGRSMNVVASTKNHNHISATTNATTTPSLVKMSKICNTAQLLSGGGASLHANMPTNGDNSDYDVQHMKHQQQTTMTRPTDNKKKITNDCDNNNYSETSALGKTLQQHQHQRKHQTSQSAQKAPKSSQLTINKSLNSPKKSEHVSPATKSIGCVSKKLLLPNTKEKLSLNIGQSPPTINKSTSAGSSPAKMLNSHHHHHSNHPNNDSSNATNGSNNNIANNSNSANGSTIWYEYGCV